MTPKPVIEPAPLVTLATFAVTPHITLYVTVGNVLGYVPSSGADTSGIINASNPTVIADFLSGKNLLEQAVQQAGGERLLAARLELPIQEGGSTRCIVGDANIMGPNGFGKLPTKFVIDAVGPNYTEYKFEEYEEVDELLMSAYGSALERAKEKKLKEVAVSLISLETKGKRSLKQVLALGLSALGYWAQEQDADCTLKQIYICAPTDREGEKIVDCGKKLGLVPEEEKGSGGEAASGAAAAATESG